MSRTHRGRYTNGHLVPCSRARSLHLAAHALRHVWLPLVAVGASEELRLCMQAVFGCGVPAAIFYFTEDTFRQVFEEQHLQEA